ncbi:hypothetical protein Tco_1285189 [Tanacetum coccineum]
MDKGDKEVTRPNLVAKVVMKVLGRLPSDMVFERKFNSLENCDHASQKISSGDVVVDLYISYEKIYALLEMRSDEETQKCNGFGRYFITGMLNVRGSVIQGFHAFKNLHPGHRQKEIEVAIEKGIRFLENKQQVGDSWYGYWEFRLSLQCLLPRRTWDPRITWLKILKEHLEDKLLDDVSRIASLGSEKLYREAVVLMIRSYLSKLSSIGSAESKTLPIEANTERAEVTYYHVANVFLKLVTLK